MGTFSCSAVHKTKQEEIREGLRNILIDFANRKKSLLDAEDLCYLLSDIREYLHSQGVVIKVENKTHGAWTIMPLIEGVE